LLERPHLLRRTRERHSERCSELADALLAASKAPQHLAPRRVGKRLEHGIE
jgi:hypothetical protein